MSAATTVSITDEESLESYYEMDISDEAYREIITEAGVYRIDQPMLLIIREGGATHRVVDANGVAHCYVAPESGRSIIRWYNKPHADRVGF